MKGKTLQPLIKIAANTITTALVISIVTSMVLGILGWLVGLRSISHFASIVQFAAIVILLLGLIGALSQSNLSLHDRQVVSWISNIHSIRDRSGFQPLLKKKVSGVSIIAITALSTAFLYGLSLLMYRLI